MARLKWSNLAWADAGDWRNRPITKLVVLGDSISNAGMRGIYVDSITVTDGVAAFTAAPAVEPANWTAGSFVTLGNCSPVEFNTKLYVETGGTNFTALVPRLSGPVSPTSDAPMIVNHGAFINQSAIGYAMQRVLYTRLDFVMRAGATIEEIHARLAEIVQYQPSHVHVWLGTNNVSEPVETAITKIESFCDDLRAAGIFVFLGALPPRPQVNPSEAITKWKKTFNAALQRYATAHYGQVKFLDYFTHMLAPGSDSYAPDGYFLTEYGTIDNAHPNAWGHDFLAELMAAELNGLGVDYAADGVNIYRNPGYAATVSIPEGVRPTGVTLNNKSGGTVTSSVTAGEWTLKFAGVLVVGVDKDNMTSIVPTGEDAGSVQMNDVFRYASIDVKCDKDVKIRFQANHTHNAVATSRIYWWDTQLFGGSDFRRIQSNVEPLEAGQQQNTKQLILYFFFPEEGDYTIVVRNPVIGNLMQV